MFGSNKNLKFIIVILVLVVLILGEIGFLGYKFWFKKTAVQKELLPVVSTFSPSPSIPPMQVKPYVQLIFGWLEELTAGSLTLTTEDGQKAVFPLNEVGIFLFKPEKEKGQISLFTFFDEDFEKRSGVERIEEKDIEVGVPAYLVLELTADDLYLGRRLVVIQE